jgi:polyhydroxyalkanoate synthase
MARDGIDRLASMTLFASQADFTEAGELMLFIDESQITFLEDIMWAQGCLETKQMAGAFQLLRSNDLVWSSMVRSYLLGERAPVSDLMAWNADATRMPYRMHSEFLRSLFLQNALAKGSYPVEGRPVSLADIRVPVFAVGTEGDHVSPWRSVYKIRALSDADVTFLLTNGGHNAGIVSEPGDPRRRYRISSWRRRDRRGDADDWFAATPPRHGSWWPEWQSWLARLSPDRAPPPPMGAPERGYPVLQDAPGGYVMQG